MLSQNNNSNTPVCVYQDIFSFNITMDLKMIVIPLKPIFDLKFGEITVSHDPYSWF